MRLWLDPASVEWDWEFHRPLVHETFHFWQLLCSPYLARMISAERGRVEAFEVNGSVPGPNPYHRAFTQADPEVGISAEQLLESWARFWEIQAQTPLYLLQQEGIGQDDVHESMWKVADPASPFYRKYYWASVEVAMARGSNCTLYGKPFRWLHNQICKATDVPPNGPEDFVPNWFGPSYLACVAYPSLLYACFQEDDPVRRFKDGVRRICASRALIGKFCSLSLNAQFVDFEWFRHWDLINREIGPTHRLMITGDHLWTPFVAPDDDVRKIGKDMFDLAEREDSLWDPSIPEARKCLEAHGTVIAFAHMGHRPFRMLLATLCAPPLMYFKGDDGIVQHSYREKEGDASALDECIFEAYGLIDRTARFKRAEKAKSLGLPADAFEAVRSSGAIPTSPV
jgi:hypothetical protein